MNISVLNHFTIRCTPDEVPMLRDFYTRALHLTAGDRPSMPRPGCWLYGSANTPIVHIYAALDEPMTVASGSVDHISFTAQELERTRSTLTAEGITFDEAPVPGTSIHQLFLRDPKGLKVELTFDLNLEGKSSI